MIHQSDLPLQLEFVRQISANPANTVVGMVRNKEAAAANIQELGRANIHIVEGDLENYASVKVGPSNSGET